MKRFLVRIRRALRSLGKHRDAVWWDHAQAESFRRHHDSRVQRARHGLFEISSDDRNTSDGMLKLTSRVGNVLTSAIKKSGPKAFEKSQMERFMGRLQASGKTADSRSISKLKLREALSKVPLLQERLGALTFPEQVASTASSGNSSPKTDVATILKRGS